jgi:hypothetical protein
MHIPTHTHTHTHCITESDASEEELASINEWARWVGEQLPQGQGDHHNSEAGEQMSGEHIEATYK